MREPRTFRELYYWLEVELAFLHTISYVIMGILLGGKWWILFLSLIVLNTIYSTKKWIKGGLDN